MYISIANAIYSSTLQGSGGGGVDNRFIITVKTDNAGTSASNQFTIPTSTTGITQAFNYDIETSETRHSMRMYVAMKQPVAFSCCNSQKRMFMRQRMRQNPLLDKWVFFDNSN